MQNILITIFPCEALFVIVSYGSEDIEFSSTPLLLSSIVSQDQTEMATVTLEETAY